MHGFTSGVLNVRVGKVAKDTVGQGTTVHFIFSDPNLYLCEVSKGTDNNFFSLSLILLLTYISYLEYDDSMELSLWHLGG